MTRWLVFGLLYLMALLAPLLLGFLLPGPDPLPPRPFRDDLASGLAMVGFAAVLVEFVLLGRFRPLSTALGSDRLMQAHQLMARTALVFLLLHPFVYSLWGSPANTTHARALRVTSGSWELLTGLLALGALLGLVFAALYRGRGLEYDRWRLWHGLLALAVLGLGLHHTLVAGRYAQWLPLQAYWWALALLALTSWLWVYLARPALQAGRPYRVSRITPQAQKIWELEIRPQGSHSLAFQPGQFVWLKLGALTPHKDHPFSISSAPVPSGELRLLIKAVGDFTNALPRTPTGITAYVDGPHGHFCLPDEAPSVIMIAGGIGIAPFLGLLEGCVQRDDGRPIRLIYADRNASQMVDVAGLSGTHRLRNFQLLRMVEQPGPDWSGLTGRLDEAGLSQALADPAVAACLPTAQVMVCGPGAMMDAVETGLAARGVGPDRVVSEHFQYEFGGRSPRARLTRLTWLALSAGLALVVALAAAWH